MSRGLTENKKKAAVFLIQLLEIILVIVLFAASFVVAGLLTYNEMFPFGESEGIYVFSITLGIAVLLLSGFKYFNYHVLFSTLSLGKTILMIFLLNLSLVVLMYFNSIIKMQYNYFIIIGAIQIFSLLFIKLISGFPKRAIAEEKIILVIGKQAERNHFIDTLHKEMDQRVIFLSEQSKSILMHLNKADEVYLMTADSELKNQIIAYCEQMNIRLFIVPEIHEIAMRNSEMTQIGDIPLFTIEGFLLTEAQLVAKRMIDIVFALVALVFALPLIAIAAIFIKIEDGGPVFYKQVRSGYNEKEFKIIKLRSMIVDAEKNTGPILANESDTRITKVGRILRSFRIDELPQLLNVLAGSMSVVGPRPERPIFVEEYKVKYPEYTHRFAVKPGITGLAQVMANYATSVENKLKFDLVYIKKYSLFFDFAIILRTIKVVFTRDQAKGIPNEAKNFAGERGSSDEHISSTAVASTQKPNLIRIALVLVSCMLIVTGGVLFRYNQMVHPIIDYAVEYMISKEVVSSDNDYIGGSDIIETFPTNVTNDENGKKVQDIGWKNKLRFKCILLTNLPTEDLFFIEALERDGLSENDKIIIMELIMEKLDEKYTKELINIVS